jgi:hypothetical protein
VRRMLGDKMESPQETLALTEDPKPQHG